MQSNIEQGYLVLVDISGFTPFVAESELDHSQAILSELLNLIIRNLSPTLTIAEIEGDAVFAYASRERLPRGETLLEMVEATYVEFRDKRASARRMATCTCKACQMIPGLDLKFITHYGEYIHQNVAGKKKPLGSCVNLIHRLLKNKVSEQTGWRGYALFTERSLKEMDVHPLNIHRQTESYEHLGEVSTYSVNLDDRYKELTDERRMVLKPEDADMVMTAEYPVTAPDLWEWLNDPTKRTSWRIGSEWHADERPQGRTGRGARNHCSNSDASETILDWRPFSYFTVDLLKHPINMTSTSTLEPVPGGTRVVTTFRLKARLPRWICRFACKLIVLRAMKMKESMDLLRRRIAEEHSNESVNSTDQVSV